MDGLKFSLLSVSQICDKGNEVKFVSNNFTVTSVKDGKVMLTAWRDKNIYVVN